MGMYSEATRRLESNLSDRQFTSRHAWRYNAVTRATAHERASGARPLTDASLGKRRVGTARAPHLSAFTA